MLTVFPSSTEQTAVLGRILGRIAESGDVILLSGTLGAGKTTLTQSIAEGLDVPGDCYVVSPSFSLMLEYPGRIPLFHIDCYRLEGEDDVEGSGLMDYIVADGLAVIEWPDRLESLKPSENLEVALDVISEEARRVVLTPNSRRWLERMDAIKAECEKAAIRCEN